MVASGLIISFADIEQAETVVNTKPIKINLDINFIVSSPLVDTIIMS